jgi:ectoine hydroxylase-related dioxygenase (phytanoyl-CoA dioxygenase family)
LTRDLDRDGYVIFENLLSPEQVDELSSRVAEAEAKALDERSVVHTHDYEAASRRLWRLPDLDPQLLRLAVVPEVLEEAHRLLGDNCILSAMNANIVGPSSVGMFLHADQDYVPLPRDWPFLVTAVWMVDPFVWNAGGLSVVPGSHSWAESAHAPRAQEPTVVPIEGPAGSVVVFDGRTWHGVTPNHSNDRRRGIVLSYCSAFLRPQETYCGHDAAAVADAFAGDPRAMALLNGVDYFRTWTASTMARAPLRRRVTTG